MSEFWWGMIFVTLYIPLLFLWGFTLFDIFTRHDIHWFSKALWALAVLFIPLIGMLVYFIARPKDWDSMAPANTNPYNPGVDYIGPATPSYASSQTSGAVRDIDSLVRMHESGTLTDEEFNRMKDKVLSEPN